MFTLTQRGKQSEISQDFWIRLQGNKQRIEISPVLLRNLIIVIFCYQISHKLLKTLRLWQVSFPLYVPLCYIIPPVFTDSGKGKSKGTRCPVDICSVPTGSQRPVDVGSEPTVVERRSAAETKKIL